ncbi:carboxypeptidase M32, partial [Candidatus Dojkabacteria bacterium]|nr:carboxypeptidase M32 [Candidatus Dojkabacteria bacterium]
MKLITNKVVLEILNQFQTIWALNYLANLAGWELETYMPEAGASDRGLALAKVKVLMQKLFLDKNFVKLIQSLSDEQNLNDYELGIKRVLEKQLDEFQKLPHHYIEEYEKAINEGQVAWRKARGASDFKIFAPYLEKITDLNIQKADYLGFSGHPYDALLDLYEEGQTTADVDAYFDSIRDFLVETLTMIKKSSKYIDSHPLHTEKYELGNMQFLNNEVLNYLNYDPNRLRLDISTHPFTSSFTSNDVRITTRYNDTDFGRSFTSTTHEFGHALYDLQCNPELDHTPIYGGM